MGIPKNQREHFIWWLTSNVKNKWTRAASPPGKPSGWRRREINADITKTGRAFIRAIEQRGYLSTPPDLEMIKSVRGYLDQVTPPKLGAPKGADDFATFLKALFIIIYALGGRVSFNRKTGKGNVVQLLNEMRPLMPRKFILNELPLATIERVLAKVREQGIASDPATADVVARILMMCREISQEQEDECVCPDCGQPFHDAPDRDVGPAILKVITGGRAPS